MAIQQKLTKAFTKILLKHPTGLVIKKTLLTVRPRDNAQIQSPIYVPESPPLSSHSWTVEEIIQLAQQDQQEITSISLSLEETPIIDLPQYGDYEIDNL